ncbi:MAG: hypothetical protein PHG27_13060 [Massilibacteroides sp.]|nr:hypothetical protein [Massilibacteroides sp.]MDD4406169.1 hypothetical protein [Parabacteroides sp.]
MPRPPKQENRAKYPEDQETLNFLVLELDRIVEKLLDDPHDTELNSERLRLEIRILALTGDEAIYDNFN